MTTVFSILKSYVRSIPPSVLLPFGVMTGAVAFLIASKLMKRNEKQLKALEHAVIIITGCDSGLGYSIALHCHELGFYVFAGVLNRSSAGAKALETLKNERRDISIIKLDITDSVDIKNAVESTEEFFINNPKYYLHGIVNNSGVMIFGEFEWQTDEMIFQQLNVNLLGTMRFSRSFFPLLRKYKGRIINVSSHCALAPLPGLSVYAASKSGLLAWNDAIRVECAKYGIKVISFVPGSFFNQSNILSKQSYYANEMKAAMTEEAAEFYSDYFDRYQAYLNAISGEKTLQRLENKKLYLNLTDALVSNTPTSFYCVSPLRYSVYHFFFGITPTKVRDYLVEKFMQMPTYKNKE